MNRYIVGVVLALSIAMISVHAETGFYIPKAYYTIDENGYKSPLIYIDSVPQIFHRARRSAQSPIVPNFGFPINFPAIPFPQPGQGGNFQSVSITSGGPGGLNNRFDENGQSAPAATINTFSSHNGHVTHMTHLVDKDGKVTTHTQSNNNNKNNNNNNNKRN